MSKIRITAKFKNFCFGLCLAGMASIGAAGSPQGGCTGVCAQCGTCGFGVLALGLWLTEKRWRWLSRMCLALGHRFHIRPGYVADFKGKEILK